MQLNMAVGTMIIDSIPVDQTKLLDVAYLQGLKIYLQEKNNEVFLNSNEEITYFVDEVPSKMNQW
jgi:hypothetical protein